MSASAWLYTIGFALFAAVVGFILELFNNGRHSNGHPVTVAIISAVIMFFLNWLIIYFFMPYFSWWSIDGWAFMFFLNTAIPIIGSFIAGASDDTYTGGTVGVVTWAIILVVWIFITGLTTPAWCDDTGLKKMAGQLNLQAATTAYPDTDLSEIIRVPESVALTKAGSILSSGPDGALGSYLAANRAYIQLIQNHPFYVVDLKVTNWLSFNQAGGVLPGYITVDAVNPDAPAVPHFGYDIHYAPSAQWGRDLDRRVYMDFLLGTSFRVQDLDGMEVDDSGVPYYVGSLEQHTIGYQGMSVTGLYQFDPQTGTGKQLTLDQKPTWLERVFPVEWFTKYATEWANWHDHKPCQFGSTLGMEMVDRTNVVAAHKSLEYQITLTSVGNDPSLTHLIAVNPTTGVSTLYEIKGKTLETIESNVESAAHSKFSTSLNYNAEACQIHRLLNRNVVYCILTYKDTSTTSLDAQNDYVIGGYSFVDLDATLNANMNSIAIGDTFDSAYADFQQIVAQSSQQGSLANTAQDIQVTGVVKALQLTDYPDSKNQSFLITVIQADQSVIYLLAPANMLNAATAIPGSNITATCYQEQGRNYLSVRHITVQGVPNLGGGALYWKAFGDWLKNIWPFGK